MRRVAKLRRMPVEHMQIRPSGKKNVMILVMLQVLAYHMGRSGWKRSWFGACAAHCDTSGCEFAVERKIIVRAKRLY